MKYMLRDDEFINYYDTFEDALYHYNKSVNAIFSDCRYIELTMHPTPFFIISVIEWDGKKSRFRAPEELFYLNVLELG